MSERRLLSVHKAYREDIGDLVTRRPLPGPGLEQIDPFLFLNHHGPQTYPPNNNGLPFGPHPHRGFETVTFILDGNLAHLDSSGGESVIEAGGVQWMTAGRGLVHAEISPDSFKSSGGPLEILQLWVNLPSRLKMTEPRYQGIEATEIPEKHISSGVVMRPVSGTEGAPIRSLMDITLATVAMEAGSNASLNAPGGHTVFFYVVRGSLDAGGGTIPEHHLARFDDGETIEISSENGCLILFGHAKPIDEPVVSHGPFVMNTRDEIMEAIRDYQAGKFGEIA
ncbi:pirin family protein [Altererythrobacter aurantiacus]|uniref:Pirin family protein n=1 Tax=Parapontixanthobacter aurantiacus TaxID=1463599 RepID=A0A844ZFH8_9SPHN|nr:pirin family protein [Parapontixanthobacter aurantiacus]MXO86528.1 pirin family protein [Parapontixanthobacter aurantiacus]